MISGPKVTFQIRGLPQMRENFRAIKAELQKKAARAAVRKASKVVSEEAKRHHPWVNKTGDLEKAIKSFRIAKMSKGTQEWWAVGVPKISGAKKYVKNTRNIRAGRAGQSWAKWYDVDAPEYYWKFLEYGTVKMAAKPFINPALDAKKEEAVRIMNEEVGQQLDAICAKLPQVQR
jgi:HK97 gp10 family phage protein